MRNPHRKRMWTNSNSFITWTNSDSGVMVYSDGWSNSNCRRRLNLGRLDCYKWLYFIIVDTNLWFERFYQTWVLTIFLNQNLKDLFVQQIVVSALFGYTAERISGLKIIGRQF